MDWKISEKSGKRLDKSQKESVIKRTNDKYKKTADNSPPVPTNLINYQQL